jgi:hypothetical protein
LNKNQPNAVQRNKDSLLEKINDHLFSSETDTRLVFDKDEQDIVLRYRAAFTKWLDEPMMKDKDMIHYLKTTFEISETQAYKDISRIKFLLGNVAVANKEFQRHRATEMILEGYDLASNAVSGLEVKQAMAMIRAAEALVKVHKLDKDEMERIPWEDIIPLELEPTTDISVIGRKRIDNLEELQQKLRKKYGSEPIDVPYTDVTDDGETKDIFQ